MGSRSAADRPKMPQDGFKTAPRRATSAPRAAPGRPKTAQDGFKTAPRRAKTAHRFPRLPNKVVPRGTSDPIELPNTSGSPEGPSETPPGDVPGPPRTPLGNDFGTNLELPNSPQMRCVCACVVCMSCVLHVYFVCTSCVFRVCLVSLSCVYVVNFVCISCGCRVYFVCVSYVFSVHIESSRTANPRISIYARRLCVVCISDVHHACVFQEGLFVLAPRRIHEGPKWLKDCTKWLQ